LKTIKGPVRKNETGLFYFQAPATICLRSVLNKHASVNKPARTLTPHAEIPQFFLSDFLVQVFNARLSKTFIQ
jgi:hypothetical protein